MEGKIHIYVALIVVICHNKHCGWVNWSYFCRELLVNHSVVSSTYSFDCLMCGIIGLSILVESSNDIFSNICM